MDKLFLDDLAGTKLLHQSITITYTRYAARSNIESQLENKKNGTLRVNSHDQVPMDNSSASLLSLPFMRSISPSRHLIGEAYDPHYNSSGQGSMPLTEMNNSNNTQKKDLSVKIREHGEEIMRLRKHLADYSIKEAQMCNEKNVLEKRIAYVCLDFDQQQQDLVDAATKALSYRQDIIEENIRLTYALQDAQQERSAFVSLLLPLLSEYSLQPPSPDARSIVSNIKVLFKHLQEKLLLTESKLKESEYQLAPWHSYNHANFAQQSPSLLNNNGLELVPQPMYSHVKTQVFADELIGDTLGRHQTGLGGGVARNVDDDELGRYPPLASRNSSTHDMPTQIQVDAHPAHHGGETSNKQVKFCDPVNNNEAEDPDGDGNQSDRETSANWSSDISPYTTTVDDPAADDDPLPGIEGLQISGEAFPGRELQACGYSINGTTSCNFEWIRHLEDGSVSYIDGAKQPNFLVTADDVNTYLAIEVQPLDDRKRKGEPVKVFANDNKKIPWDPEMQNHIERILHSGNASFKVSLSAGYLDIWEPATLAIKREGYSIKCNGPNGVVITEKFSPSTVVVIPYGHVSEFILIDSSGGEHLLRAENSSTDVSGCRDTIVLTLRVFILKAGKKNKGRKGLFFNK